MSRNEKISKLTSAIKEYRGSYDSKTKKWIKPPSQKARARVERWLVELTGSIDDLHKIDAFANFEEFHRWIKTL